MSVLGRSFDLLSYLCSHCGHIDILMWPIYPASTNGPISLEEITHTHTKTAAKQQQHIKHINLMWALVVYLRFGFVNWIDLNKFHISSPSRLHICLQLGNKDPETNDNIYFKGYCYYYECLIVFNQRNFKSENRKEVKYESWLLLMKYTWTAEGSVEMAI